MKRIRDITILHSAPYSSTQFRASPSRSIEVHIDGKLYVDGDVYVVTKYPPCHDWSIAQLMKKIA